MVCFYHDVLLIPVLRTSETSSSTNNALIQIGTRESYRSSIASKGEQLHHEGIQSTPKERPPTRPNNTCHPPAALENRPLSAKSLTSPGRNALSGLSSKRILSPAVRGSPGRPLVSSSPFAAPSRACSTLRQSSTPSCFFRNVGWEHDRYEYPREREGYV